MSYSGHIPIPGTFNFRDLSAIRMARGVIRPGVLFRSDSLHALGEEGRQALRALRIGTVIDLRDEHEIKAKPDDLDGSGFRHLNLAVFEGRGVSLHLHTPNLAALYQTVVTQHAAMLVEVLREISQDDGTAAVLVHCGTGKDRTGIVVALALLAVGAERASVVDDYAATQQYISSQWLEQTMETAFARYGAEDTPALRALIGGCAPEALEAAIDDINRNWGSVRQYLLAHGLDPSALARLQHVLVQE